MPSLQNSLYSVNRKIMLLHPSQTDYLKIQSCSISLHTWSSVVMSQRQCPKKDDSIKHDHYYFPKCMYFSCICFSSQRLDIFPPIKFQNYIYLIVRWSLSNLKSERQSKHRVWNQSVNINGFRRTDRYMRTDSGVTNQTKQQPRFI